jgi:hypothetical protein
VELQVRAFGGGILRREQDIYILGHQAFSPQSLGGREFPEGFTLVNGRLRAPALYPVSARPVSFRQYEFTVFRFEWDPRKVAANLRSHGVSFAEAATVLEDDLRVTTPSTMESRAS